MGADYVILQGGSIHSAKPPPPVILPKYVEGLCYNDPLEQIHLRMLAEALHCQPTLLELWCYLRGCLDSIESI